MKRLLLVVFLITSTVPLFAQQGENLLNGFQFVAPLRLTTGTDNNFLVDRTDPNEKLLVLSLSPSVQPGAPSIKPVLLDDKFFMLTLPKIGYKDESRRHEFTATWVPEFEMYKTNSDQNSWSQQATVGFNYFLSRNVQISVGDNYRTSHDPARTLQNVFLLLPRGEYKDNAIRGSVDFQPNAVTSVGIRYDRTSTRFGETDPFQARILDSKASGYTLNFTRMLSRTHRLRGLYSVFKMSPVNHAETNDDAVDTHVDFGRSVHSASLQYRMALGRGTIVQIAGGLIRLHDGHNYTFQGTLDKRIATYYWLGASYSRTLTFLSGPATGFAQGLGGNGFYDVVVLRFNGQPTRKTAFSIDTTYAASAAARFVESNRGLMARARLDYRVSDRTVLFTSMESLQQKKNVYVQAPLARNRFSVGIEFSLASEASRRTSSFNEDTRIIDVTDRPRRRTSADQED
jgi:hypothetical protein